MTTNNINSNLVIDSLVEREFFVRPLNKVLDFYLTEEIGPAQQYETWFQAIRAAEPGDQVVIHINSYGGDLNTTIQLLQCINESQATILVSLEGRCYSAATMVFLACDSYQIAPYSSMMIHNFSGGTFGKGNEMQAQVEFEKTWFSEMAKNVYSDFLTPEEINDVLRGVDIWLTPDEVHERMSKRIEAEEARIKQQEQDDSTK
jgi:ATP-dependent protease ClpP protease subunit